MKQCEAFDGIAQNAGDIIMTFIDSEKSVEQEFVSSAKRNLKWINRKAMRNALSTSTFDLAELKSGKASVYLVLPPELLKNEGNFLRLFVLSAINAMAKGGSGRGEKCLFILDEFFSLGKIDLLTTASGLLPSFGVHLWPILQNAGDLIDLYGKEGSETFYANADLHQFFGNTDPLTLDLVSKRLGVVSHGEIRLPPSPPAQHVPKPVARKKDGAVTFAETMENWSASSNAQAMAEYQAEMNAYQHDASRFGKPRYSPDEVAQLVERQNDDVADNFICFVFGNNPLLVTPAPYFRSQHVDDLDKNIAAKSLFNLPSGKVLFHTLAISIFTILTLLDIQHLSEYPLILGLPMGAYVFVFILKPLVNRIFD